MNKFELQQQVEKGLSIKALANHFNKGQTTIRYWLEKHGLKTSYQSKYLPDTNGKRHCTKCDEWHPISDFYKSKSKTNRWCKSCFQEYVLERQRTLKLKAIEYKGGECERCGYNKCPGALQFHHRDPSKKDPQWKDFKVRAFTPKVQKELDKCELLCANCHAEEHTVYC